MGLVWYIVKREGSEALRQEDREDKKAVGLGTIAIYVKPRKAKDDRNLNDKAPGRNEAMRKR